MKGNMRIDKRFYEQIDRALAGVNLPVTVYTAGGEQVYPASPREIREEEIPTLPWEEDMAVFGSMRFLRLPFIILGFCRSLAVIDKIIALVRLKSFSLRSKSFSLDLLTPGSISSIESSEPIFFI